MIANAGPRQENLDRQVILVKRSEDSHFGIVADGLGEIPEILASRLQALPGLLAGGNVLAESIITPESPDTEKLLVVLSIERIVSRLMAACELHSTTAVVPSCQLLGSARSVSGTGR